MMQFIDNLVMCDWHSNTPNQRSRLKMPFHFVGTKSYNRMINVFKSSEMAQIYSDTLHFRALAKTAFQ